MSTYKPTEHDGLKQDGTPDKRVSSEHGLGADRERASELGKQGGKASGSIESAGSEESGDYTPSGGEDTATGETYKPSEHDGLKKNGEPDGRVKGNN